MAASRADKRAAIAKEALIQAAERLFGDYGLEAVALRQVVAAAGLSNNFAVQYHFGDKAGLVNAIFERRLAELEARRDVLLQAAVRQRRDRDPRTLVEVLFRPVAELRDAEGRRAYAAFLLALQQSAEGYRLRMDVDALAPITREVMRRVAAAAPHVPPLLMEERRLAASAVVFTSLVQRDRQQRRLAIDDQLLDDAFDIAAGIFTAPVAEGVRKAVESLQTT
jgi:AcrR family transcriptional regulator